MAIRSVEETSAGGLVIDRSGPTHRAVLIGRRDRKGVIVWSLPKGHVELGETPDQTAVREVLEETGIASVVLAPLGVIDFWFMSKERRVHKTVHHFLLEARGGELSDADSEVDEVAWVPIEELDARLGHEDERELLPKLDVLLAELP